MGLKRGPLAVDRGAAKIEHRLGAVDRPTHAGTLHPVFHDVPASALDHAAGNGQAGRQVFVVTHSIAVAMKVIADPRELLPFHHGQVSLGRHLAQTADDVTDLAAKDA